jgi:FMN phosphatase YigB (HAD superfamily)
MINGSSCHDLRMISTVVFDLGGVLARVARNWQEAGAKQGLNLTSDRAVEPLSLDPVLHAFQAAEIMESEYYERLSSWLGIEIPQAEKLHGDILIYEYPGALALVREIRETGLKTACLSNTNEPHWRILLDPRYHPAIAALEIPLASHRLEAAKPDVRAYEKTEAAVGNTEILFFDDTAKNLPPAEARGWQCRHVPPVDNPVPWIREQLVQANLLPA